MITKSIATNLANGTIHYPYHSIKLSDIEWVKHPSFEGVYLKHMIKGAETEGFFSSHLVKVDSHCALETHCHKNHIELHEVIEGDGIFRINDKDFGYYPGITSVTHKGVEHRVQAGKKGITLLAKFFPALL